MPPSAALSRRDFLKLVKAGLIDLTLLAALGGAYATWLEPNWPAVTRRTIPIPGLPDAFAGLRIAQISDIHMGGWMDRARLQRVLELVTRESPDLLVLTGDFVSGHERNDAVSYALADLRLLLSELRAKMPVYAVLGNHDHWVGPEHVRGMLAACGVTELSNRAVSLERGGDRLYLCGVDSAWEGKNDIASVLAETADPVPAILLAHEPDPVDGYAATGRFALQLSGHSHGGQVALPFWGPIHLPWLAQTYGSGSYQVNGMWLYVNRGVGMVRPYVRLFCRPEVLLATLQPA